MFTHQSPATASMYLRPAMSVSVTPDPSAMIRGPVFRWSAIEVAGWRTRSLSSASRVAEDDGSAVMWAPSPSGGGSWRGGDRRPCRISYARHADPAPRRNTHDGSRRPRSPRSAPRGAETPRPRRLPGAARRRAPGGVRAAPRRAPGLADRVHRVGRPGGGPHRRRGDLRGRTLHAAGPPADPGGFL